VSAAGTISLRVTVGDTWTPLPVEAGAGETVAALKARVLAGARMNPAAAPRYEVKLGGVLVRDESQTLTAAGLRDGSPVIVLARRRRPVR
jgi:hypothetical protein